MHPNPHERDRQLVGVQAPGGCLDPVLESVPLPALGPQQHNAGRLHEQNAQVAIAAHLAHPHLSLGGA
jgi:hypothetical protein